MLEKIPTIKHFQFSLSNCEPKIAGIMAFLAKQGDYENENCDKKGEK